jgi:hypothetical protein
MRHNVPPDEYFAYALWLPERRKSIDEYLYTAEATRIFKALNRPVRRDPIGDKLAFHRMCTANALPTPAIFAAFAPTERLLPFEGGRPPESDLFVKPSVGSGGDGGECFRWVGRSFENGHGFSGGPEEFEAYLAIRAAREKRTLLVQPLLTTHADLRTGAEQALATLRLVTGLSSNGEVFAIFGYLYFAFDNRTGRPWHVSGLVDVRTGKLDSVPLESRSEWIFLPGQSAWNEIYSLPEWDLILRYVGTAHRACSNVVFVGWDVAITEGGPVLLEGNGNWSAYTYQLLSGEPLGRTEFAAVLATRLDRNKTEAARRMQKRRSSATGAKSPS